MADACRLTPHSLSSHAAAKTEFDFFHVLRRLENRHRDKPRIGRALRLAQDMVRLGQAASLAFPSSAIASVDTSAELGHLLEVCQLEHDDLAFFSSLTADSA